MHIKIDRMEYELLKQLNFVQAMQFLMVGCSFIFLEWSKTFAHYFYVVVSVYHSWNHICFGWEISTFAIVSLSRGISTASLLCSSGVTPPSASATLSQPIVISDTPSPAVSIITIHSDTDTEDERKFHPSRWGQDTPLHNLTDLWFLKVPLVSYFFHLWFNCASLIFVVQKPICSHDNFSGRLMGKRCVFDSIRSD